MIEKVPSMSPDLFRKLVRQSFDLDFSDGELAAVVSEFDMSKNNTISCSEFIIKFIQWGADRRATERLSELETTWSRESIVQSVGNLV